MREEIDQDEDYNMEVLENLIHVIKQEQLHPTLLRFQKEIFDRVKDMLSEQRIKLKGYLKYEDETEINLSIKNFRYMIYNAEIEKVDYLLKTYLKNRLKKIQIYCFYLIKNQHQAEKMLSAAEFKFLRKYADMRYQYYKDNVFKYLVKNYRDFKGIQIILAKNQQAPRERQLFIQTKQSQIDLKQPNLNDYVFAQILSNPNQLRFGIDIPVSNVSSQHMEVVSQGTIIYAPFRVIHDRIDPKEYKLI